MSEQGLMDKDMRDEPRDPPQHTQQATDQQRRAHALRQLATQHDAEPAGGAPPAPPAPASTQHTKRRLWLAAVVTALLIALVATGALIWLRPSSPATPRPPRPKVTLIQFPDAATGLLTGECPQQAIWSPDGGSIAVISQEFCDQQRSPLRNQILLVYAYNGANARWRPRFGFDLFDLAHYQGVLPQRLSEDPEFWNKVRIEVSPPVWSPDSRELALLYAAWPIASTQTTQPYSAGVVTIPSSNRDADASVQAYPQRNTGAILRALARITAGQQGSPAAPVPPGAPVPPAAPVLRFDTRTGTLTEVPVPPALGYRWTPDGTLTPIAPLPAPADATPPPAAPAGPVGNPSGDSGFTLYAGEATLTAGGATCATGADYALLALRTGSWSPDTRYVAFGLAATGRLPAEPNATPRTPCQPLGPASAWPALPLRDAALPAVPPAMAQAQTARMALAWRRDGTRLAVAPAPRPARDGLTPPLSTPAVTVYDTATGQVAVQITLAQLRQADPRYSLQVPVGITSLAWSADGRTLLALDAAHRALILIQL